MPVFLQKYKKTFLKDDFFYSKPLLNITFRFALFNLK